MSNLAVGQCELKIISTLFFSKAMKNREVPFNYGWGHAGLLAATVSYLMKQD